MTETKIEVKDFKKDINFNYYGSSYPSLNSIVFVKVKEFSEDSNVIVNLIEYSNIQGMILSTEINKRPIRPEKIFNHNNIYPCVVIHVDKTKGYVDLSYKKLSTEDRELYSDIYPVIEKIINFAKESYHLYSQKQEVDITTFMENTFYHILKKKNLVSKDINNIYNSLLEYPDTLFMFNKSLDNDILENILESIKSRIKSTDIILESPFKLIVIENNAIDIIKNLLTTNVPSNTKIYCTTSPKYIINVTSSTNEEGNEKINTFMEDLINKIKNNSNIFIEWNKNIDTLKNKIFSISPLKLK
jgi:translation initiation factor 2 alpha subunit (eIF-2alpha)